VNTTIPLDDMPAEAIAYYQGVAFVPVGSSNHRILRLLRRAGFVRLSRFSYEGRPMAKIHWRGK
jgi:hypothetical protein